MRATRVAIYVLLFSLPLTAWAIEAASLSGKYVIRGGSDYLDLKQDGTFSAFLRGKNRRGAYKVEGDVVILRLKNELKTSAFRFVGATLVGVQNGSVWERETHIAAIVSAPEPNVAVPDATVSSPGPPSTDVQRPSVGGRSVKKMTNQDVMAMVAAGLSEEVVTNSVRMSRDRDFDVSPGGLIALKKANVPDGVIDVMQGAGGTPETDTDTAKPSNDHASPSQARAAAKPDGSAYVGKWNATDKGSGGYLVNCPLDISRNGESFLIRLEEAHGDLCKLYEGIFVLTAQGNLNGGPMGMILLSYDKQTNRIALSSPDGVQYLQKR